MPREPIGCRPLPRLMAVINALADAQAALADAGDRRAVVGRALARFEAPPPHYSDDALDAVIDAARLLDPVFDVLELDGAARLVNSVLAEAGGAPRLSDHDGSPWHLHVDRTPFDWRTWFLSSGALALAVALSENGRIAWGRCRAGGCGRVFQNTGRGAVRLFCSNRCASRIRVARQRSMKGMTA